MKRKITFILFFLLSGLLSRNLDPAAGKLNFGAGYTGSYSDNIFFNVTNVKDYISEIQADIDLSFKKLNLYLGVSADIYADNPEYNSLQFEPGIEWVLPLKDRDALYLGFNYSILKYKDIYTDFNADGPLFQASVKLYTSSFTLLKVGLQSQYRNFVNFSSFDYFYHRVLVELHRFFKSQTTLRLQAGFNYRYYPHILDFFDFGDNYRYYQNRARYGKSTPGKGKHSQSQKEDFHTLSIPGAYGILGVDQGIGTRLGISGELEIRESFRGLDFSDAETLIKNAYSLYPQNDDHLWTGTRLAFLFKVALASRLAIEVEGGISYFDKKYPGILVMDDAGEPIQPLLERKDSLWLYMLKITKKSGRLEFYTHFVSRNNHSNDGYFFYNLLTLSAGISYYF